MRAEIKVLAMEVEDVAIRENYGTSSLRVCSLPPPLAEVQLKLQRKKRARDRTSGEHIRDKQKKENLNHKRVSRRPRERGPKKARASRRIE